MGPCSAHGGPATSPTGVISLTSALRFLPMRLVLALLVVAAFSAGFGVASLAGGDEPETTVVTAERLDATIATLPAKAAVAGGLPALPDRVKVVTSDPVTQTSTLARTTPTTATDVLAEPANRATKTNPTTTPVVEEEEGGG